MDLETESWRDSSGDLLTAALIGAALGAGTAFLLQQGWQHRDDVGELARGAGRLVRRRPKSAWERARGLADRMDLGDARDQVHNAVEAVREAVSDAVRDELRGLRKTIRRQRRRFGS